MKTLGVMKPITAQTTLMAMESGYYQALADVLELVGEKATDDVVGAIDAARKFCLLRTGMIDKQDYDGYLALFESAVDGEKPSDGTSTPEK